MPRSLSLTPSTPPLQRLLDTTARLWGLYPPPRTQPQRLRFAISY
jgi:hypothetical protein